MRQEDVTKQQSGESYGDSVQETQSQPGTYQDPLMNGQN